MADTVGSLFNLPTAAQAGQQYYEGLMTSPAQMNQLGLLQQVVAMGRDGGASLGYGAGRLLGGKTADEVRIQGVNEAMAEATSMGGSDAEMYANLAKGLSARGLTQDALAATEKARAAKRDEQTMALAESQEARARKADIRLDTAEGRAAEREDREKQEFEQRMAEYPLEIQAKELALRKAEQDLNGAMGEVSMTQDALTKGVNPKTGQPLTEVEARGLQARLAQALLAINNEAAKIANEKAEHEKKMRVYDSQIAENTAQAANANATRGMSAFKQKATIQVPGVTPMDRPITYDVGTQNGYGQVRGKDGKLYNTVNEAALAQGIIGGVTAGAAPAGAAPAPAPAQTEAPPQPSWFDRLFSTPPAAPAKTPQKPLSAY